MENENLAMIVAVKHATRRFDNLAIARAREFTRATVAVGMHGQLLDGVDDAMHELRGGQWIRTSIRYAPGRPCWVIGIGRLSRSISASNSVA